jgi:hypothetical protein
VVIELQRYAHDVIAFLVQEAGGDGRVHPARHGDDHAGIFGFFSYAETV